MTKHIITVLERFGVDVALIGDMAERRQTGASDLWFWRQAFAAVVFKIGRTLRTHWALSLRAAAVGWLLMTGLQWVFRPQIVVWNRGFGVTVGNILLTTDHEMARWVFLHYHLWTLPQVFATCAIGAFTAWVVGRTHREHRAVMVTVLLCGAELYCAIWVLTGWRWAMTLPAANGYPYTALLTGLLLVPSIIIAGMGGTSSARSPTRDVRAI